MNVSERIVSSVSQNQAAFGLNAAESGIMPVLMSYPKDLWNDHEARDLTESEALLYRSNLLGADLSVTNFGGGNTSAKIEMRDPLTDAPVEVLWVKGSGGDLGSMGLDGFATLSLERLRGLERRYRGLAFEDEMPELMRHCAFGLNQRAASIDTQLHAFINHRHVDHLHPDAVIALAATHESEALTREVYGDEVGWIAWQRPGFDLALKIRDALRAHPQWRGLVLEGHGLFSWAGDAKACYRNSLDLIVKAVDFVNARLLKQPAFGGPRLTVRTAEDREALFTRVAPLLRVAVSQASLKLAHVNTSATVLDFVCSEHMAVLAPQGTSCPDHFLRTKIKPMVLDPERLEAGGSAYIDEAVAVYRADYQAYYERCKRPDSPALRDANPVIVLVPGYGMISFAATKSTARVASEYYTNAINVMRGAGVVGTYKALPEQEAFDIEYWLLEDAKLKRQPPPKAFAGQVAYISGAAGGIGRAIAEQFLAGDACVVLADIDGERLEAVKQSLSSLYKPDQIRAMAIDVTDEAAVLRSFAYAACEFGGIDILVANAGIASSAAVEDTSLDMWRRNFEVLSEGYFLTAREAFKTMKGQDNKGLGGSIIFVASKNALAASANASAYCAAKAAELQLARCLALEGAAHGIRVNVVNPDAVIRGSSIWSGAWRSERAAAYNMAEEDLEDFYRNRSLLKRSVYPEDVAAAVVFLASDAASKSTGNILNVDAGNAVAFTR